MPNALRSHAIYGIISMCTRRNGVPRGECRHRIRIKHCIWGCTGFDGDRRVYGKRAAAPEPRNNGDKKQLTTISN